MRPAAWAAAVVGLLLVGVAAGQLLFPRTVVEAAPQPTADVEALPQVASVMPDLLGLDEATARRALSDAGVTAEVTLTRTPAAGAEGLVVAQEPMPGLEPRASVTLTLSTMVTVPTEVVGASSVDDARELLESLGAVVRVTEVVDPGAVEGVVLSADPAPGQPLGAAIDLVVAAAGEGVLLTQLDEVDSDRCSTISDGTLDGVAVQDSVSCEGPSTEPRTAGIEWVVARSASVLETMLGVLDRGEPGTAVVRVIGDEALLAETPVAYGASTPLRLDVRGVLRLRVEVQVTGGDPTVVLGDGRVVGTADQVAALLAAQ
ncbi:PASTA domain-containing protein [Actinotalea solisilvae]|uniref:PASTA domain-containing protein n=1 Tax=Actinotalea solisilvae TaxID=2072922 RepID=UPI0018F16833|nr:PASTA domain-containing protein [Actinotalea solisilvae]